MDWTIARRRTVCRIESLDGVRTEQQADVSLSFAANPNAAAAAESPGLEGAGTRRVTAECLE